MDAGLKESRDYCQLRVSQLHTDFKQVRGEMKRIQRDPKRFLKVVSLWARTFRQWKAVVLELEDMREIAPTMVGLDVPEIAKAVVKDASTLATVRRTLDRAGSPTLNRLSQSCALIDAIRVEALAIVDRSLVQILSVGGSVDLGKQGVMVRELANKG